MVFVPYRGLIFLNSKKDFVGELQEVFPSPTGDLYFSIEISLKNKSRQFSVSVPYRGLIFLNAVEDFVLYEDVDVSVPYWGLIFLNQYNNIKCAGMPKFPSPTGDLYFSMAVKIEIAKSFKKVSVPYRGLIFLNGSAWGGIEPPYTVSVPYRGLIFLNATVKPVTKTE